MRFEHKEEKMRSKVAFLIAALMLVPLLATAGIIVGPANYDGSRSTGDGPPLTVTAADGWSGSGNAGFQIAWHIEEVTDGWSYSYTISGEGGSDLGKALSHWILEVSEGVDLNLGGDPVSDGPKLFEPSDSSGDQPDMPGNLYGIKWNTTGEPAIFTTTFTSSQAPIWGDFYAKDGRQGGPGPDKDIFATAWNIGFGTEPTAADAPFTNWIPTPDTVTVIPEPRSVVAIAAIGVLGLVGLVRQRRRKA